MIMSINALNGLLLNTTIHLADYNTKRITKTIVGMLKV